MITINAAITNNADFITTFQFNDADTGDLIDFTGASIEIEIREEPQWSYGNYGYCIQASIDNGLIAIISTGIFELNIPVAQMQNLCRSSYPWGGVYKINDETISLFTGSLTVISGNSHL